MNCSNCAAPIPAKSNICRFCGTVNDTDLRQVSDSTHVGPQGDRPCPRCGVLMNSIDIGMDGGFVIERCATCYGLFFDTGELESLVDASTSDVVRIDREKINTLIEEEGGVETNVKYVKCPVCHELMNRRAYGARSGVVADTCKAHGVWLDGGELRRILNWAKAGGQIHADRRKKEEEERAERQKRTAKALDSERAFGGLGSELGESDAMASGLLGVLLRLFR